MAALQVSEDSNYFCCLECHPWHCPDCQTWHCNWFEDKCRLTGQRNEGKATPKLVTIEES